jgi:hypothetical protein
MPKFKATEPLIAHLDKCSTPATASYETGALITAATLEVKKDKAAA